MPGTWPRFASAVLAAVCCSARAQEGPGAVEELAPPTVLVREGNALFGQEAFEEALGKYDRAKLAVPDSAELAFDRGLTQFKLGRLDEAADSLNRAVLAGDRDVEALSKFLLGNVRHLQGVEAGEENPQAAIEALRQATGYYLDALELQPDNDDLRSNIELTQKLIELIRQKQDQQQQQDQSEQQGDKEGEQQQDQQEQEQQQQGEEQEEQEDPEQQQEQQGEEREGQEEQENPEQKQASEQQEQEASEEEQQQQGAQQEQAQEQQQAQSAEEDEEQQKQARQVSQEQAERMFQQIRDKERQRRLEKARRERRKAKPVKRDW